MSLDDPFYVVKEEVQRSVNTLNGVFQRWEQIEREGSSDVSEMEWTLDQVNHTISGIEWDLQELENTIEVVTKQRSRFKVDDEELESRRDFVLRTRQRVDEIKQATKGTRARDKIQKKKREALMGTSADSYKSKLDREIESDNQDFIHGEASAQQLIMRQQDEELDDLGAAVSRIKDVSLAINDELDSQKRMVDDIDRRVDTVSGRLKETQERLKKFAKLNKDGGKICTIVILTIVLFALIGLLIQG